MIKKILFPTDFSKCANNALPFALDLAKRNNAKLFIVNVYYTTFSEPIDSIDSPNYEASSLERIIHQKLDERMEELIESYNLGYYDYETALLFGIPTIEIEEFIEKHDIDLIVMGTKGESEKRLLFMGSVTKGLIENAACPVLAIPGDCKFGAIEKIAYATDLRFDETKAVKYFIKMAEMYKATLIVFHLDVNRDRELEHIKKLKKIVDNANYPLITYQELIVDNIAAGIEDFVQNNEINMLAMTATTTSFLDKILHRSLTKKMLFQTHIPLLTIRRNKKDILFF